MASSPEKPCLNCETPLAGPYCAQCGQKDTDPTVGFRTVAGEFFGSMFSLDSRVYRTLRRLFLKPGVLTAAYWAGRRQRYFPPFKLYLFATFLAFLMLNSVDARLLQVRQGSAGGQSATEAQDQVGQKTPAPADELAVTPNGAVDEEAKQAEPGVPETASQTTDNLEDEASTSYFRRRFFEKMRLVSQDEKRANRMLIQLIPKGMFVVLPLFALFLRLFYWKSPWRYPQWVIFALYYHAFAFFLIAVGAGFIALGWLPIFRFLATLLLPLYLLLALKKLTQQSWPKTILKLCGFLALYLPSLLLILAVIGLLTIWNF